MLNIPKSHKRIRRKICNLAFDFKYQSIQSSKVVFALQTEPALRNESPAFVAGYEILWIESRNKY